MLNILAKFLGQKKFTPRPILPDFPKIKKKTRKMPKIILSQNMDVFVSFYM